MSPAALKPAFPPAPKVHPIPLSSVQPGVRFSLLSDNQRVFARVQHPSMGVDCSRIDVVCVDTRDHSDAVVGTAYRFARESLVVLLAKSMPAHYAAL